MGESAVAGRGRTYFWVAFSLAVLLPTASVAVLERPSAARAAPVSKCPAEAADEPAAVQAAADCHGRVEVAADRTETTQVFADPAGTLTAQIAAVAQRVVDPSGKWVKTDPTLRSDGDGRFVAAATVLGLSFSGGGDGPAVTISKGRARLGLTWPGRLPAPTVSGASVTYPEVYPGVDLVFTAQVEGFAETLVVKNAAAAANPALAAVRFATTTAGLKLRQDANGALTAVDGTGATLFGSGTPAMWDFECPRGRAAGRSEHGVAADGAGHQGRGDADRAHSR